MSWRTSKSVLVVRNVVRSIGLTGYIARRLYGSDYEAKYDIAFQKALRHGDCVWDIGANIGYYTKLFSQKVDREGVVFAFEPSPVNFSRLSSNCTALDNVQLRQIGLGESDCSHSFQQGEDELGATSRVTPNAEGGVLVEIRTAASLIKTGDALPPCAIKIDVEGFELEVLLGFGDQLADTKLKLIGIEVHFGILKERGLPQVPRKIEELLCRYGFGIVWPDSSHILATRN